MSTFRLLKRHFHNARFLTIIFTICQICSVICFCFLFLYTASVQKHNIGNHTTIVNLNSDITKTEIIYKLDDFISENSDKIERIYFLSYIDEENPVKVNIFHNELDGKFLMAGEFFNNENSTQQSPACIVNAANASYRVGDFVELYGIEHKVIGISMYKYWELDIHSLPYVSELTNLEIIFFKDINEADIEICESEINQLFDNLKTTTFQDKLSFFECISLSELILFLVILLVININFAGLFMYIVKEDDDVVKTFMILGCPLKVVLRKTIQEILVLCCGAFIVGIIIFQTLIAPIISLANHNFVRFLPWINICSMAIIYLICVFLIFTPLVYKYYKKKFYKKNMEDK